MILNEPDPMRRNEHSRRKILDAAIAVVAERGYEGSSMERIAERAGVGKQTIYRWWPSKGAVILEALEELVVKVTPLPLQDTSDIVDDLRHQMQLAMLLLNSPDFGPAFRAVVAAAQSDPALARQCHDKLIELRAAPLRALLAQAQAHGKLRSGVDLDTVIDMLFGVLFYRVLLQTRPPEPAQIDAALDIVFEGLR